MKLTRSLDAIAKSLRSFAASASMLSTVIFFFGALFGMFRQLIKDNFVCLVTFSFLQTRPLSYAYFLLNMR